MDFWSKGQLRALFLEHEVSVEEESTQALQHHSRVQDFTKCVLVCVQGYFGAVGALMELLKTTEDPWWRWDGDTIDSSKDDVVQSPPTAVMSSPPDAVTSSTLDAAESCPPQRPLKEH